MTIKNKIKAFVYKLISDKKTVLLSLISLIPIIYLIAGILSYPVNIPFMDEFELIPILDKFLNNKLNLFDLFAQHNEHRIFFSRLIMLGIIKLWGWKTVYFSIFSFALALAMFILLGHEILKFSKKEKINLSGIIPLLSFLIFSMSQSCNWFIMWQISIFMNILGISIGCYYLTRSNLKISHFTFAVLAGIFASYSFGNGILFWFIGLFIIANLSYENLKSKIIPFTIWAIITAIIIILYMNGYHKPGTHPSLLFSFANFNQFKDYFFAFLGAPLSASLQYSIFFGLSGFTFFIASYIYLQKQVKQKNFILYFFSLGLYAIVSSFTIALGRAGFGAEQAMESRYITISNLMWITNIIFLVLSYKIMLLNNHHKLIKNLTAFCTFTSILIVTIFVIARIPSDNRTAMSDSTMLKANRELIMNNELDSIPDNLYLSMYKDPARAKKLLHIVQKNGYFRNKINTK